MNNPTEKSQPETVPGVPTGEEIETRACQIYIERGGVHGQDVEDWVQAECEFVEKYDKPVQRAKAAAA